MKTNEEYLRDLIADNDEAIEFLDAMVNDHNEKVDELKTELENADDEITDLKNKIEDEPSLESVDLGLDTLHYRLEHGNLLIQQRLESFLRSANTIPNAEPLFS